MPFRIQAAALLAALLAAAPASARVWDQQWEVGGRPTVVVTVSDAHVRIHAGDAHTVTAHVLHEYHRWGLVTGTPDPDVVFSRSGDEIHVQVHEHAWFTLFGGISERLTVDVTVPPASDLSVRTGDGAVDCEPVSGHVRIATGDGALRARGLRGDLDLSTHDGGLDADDLDGSLRAHTGDGHLRVSGRFDRLELASGDGRLEAVVMPGSKLADDWSVHTGDGSLSLRIPSRLQALLDARSNDGHLNVDLPIEVRGALAHEQLTGRLNGGGPTLLVRSGDGAITLGLSD